MGEGVYVHFYLILHDILRGLQQVNIDKFDWERVCKQNIYIFPAKTDWRMTVDCSEGADVSLQAVIAIPNRTDFFPSS